MRLTLFLSLRSRRWWNMRPWHIAFCTVLRCFTNRRNKNWTWLRDMYTQFCPGARGERLGESGATHDSQSQSASIWGWGSFGVKSQWVRGVRCWCPSRLAGLHDSRLSTPSQYPWYQSCNFSIECHVCHDNHCSFVYDSPNPLWSPSDSVRTVSRTSGPTWTPDSPSLSNISDSWLVVNIVWPKDFLAHCIRRYSHVV